jgi:hypothetical protein
MKKSHYDIQFYMEPPVDKWSRVIGFCDMQKSFAEGAWAMLKSFSNQRYKHRLLKDGVVIDEIGYQKINLN